MGSPTSSNNSEHLFGKFESALRRYLESKGFTIPNVVDSVGLTERMILFKAHVVPVIDRLDQEAEQYSEDLLKFGVDLDMMLDSEKNEVKRILGAMAQCV